MMRCHSVRVLYSLLSFSFQLTLVASDKRVQAVPFGVERLSASWPRKPMRVMRFLQSMCLSSFRAPIGWGDPGAKGAALQASEAVFRRVKSGLFGALQKAKPAIREGNRNPLGLE